MSGKRDFASRTGLVGEGLGESVPRLGESSQLGVDLDQGVDLGPGMGQSIDLRVLVANLCLWVCSRRITGVAVRRPTIRLLVATFRGEFPSSSNGSKAPRSARIDDMIVSECGQSPYLLVESDDDIC